MSPATLLLTALTSLAVNKLRAGLTLLGIVIGITAVITLMAIGQGVQQSITQRIESLGTNLLFVRPGESSQGGVFGGQGSASTLTMEDAIAIQDPVFAPSVAAVAPELSTTGQVVSGRSNTSTRVYGVTPEYLEARNFDLSSGEFITPGHVNAASLVAVLGSEVTETLFGNREPIGQAVRINGRQFEVIGVLESKGGNRFFSLDDQVLVPITTAHHRLASRRTAQGAFNVQTINVQVADLDRMDSAIREVATVLRLRHRISGEDDFSITSQQETIETLQETTGTFVVFLGAIAGISLLVGGIGIMNIMLVSVTERTREIGIRKAMGAKYRDILLQFVAEATLLSLGGGSVGVLTGILLSWALNGRSLLGGQPTQTVFSGEVAVMALAVSAGIGLFFGIYPAMRAARLHPIEALRSE